MNLPKCNPDWWKQLFDELYLVTDARSVCNDEITAKEVKLVRRLLSLEKKHRILDLCAGHGRHSLQLARHGFRHCLIVDYSPVLLAKALASAAKEKLPLAGLRADARQLPFRNGTFHRVMILGNSFGYGERPSDDEKILREALRILRPDGLMGIDVADGASVRSRFHGSSWHEIGDDVVVCRQRRIHGSIVICREMILSKSRGLLRDQGYRIRIYEATELRELLEGIGFRQVQIHTCYSQCESHQEDYGFMNQRIFVVGRR